VGRVCHITTVHLPFDDRIFHKECKTIAKAGYEVYLIAQQDKEEIIGGVHIIPLPKRKRRLYRFLIKDWVALFKALKVNADIYHFHDPELIFVGLILKVFGKKVIYDIHELVYFQIENKQWLKFNIMGRALQKFYSLVESISIKFFDQFILAEDGYKDYFMQKYGSLNKCTIIRNFPILKLIDNTKPINIKKNKLVVIYAGGLTRIRGIKEIVQAMEYTDNKAELWLLGKWESENFKKECENLKGWKYTKYLGLKSLEEVYSYMKVVDIGISILYPIKNYLTSLPVKAFEYMACGLPIIMSNFIYWQKIFGECALFADSQDPKDIAKKIDILLCNEDLRIKLGKAGRSLTEEKYSWENESKKLIELYKNLLDKDMVR
jgi:glycosyltransferase involved in cell wall biosynthesis